MPVPKLAYDHAQSMTAGLVTFYRDIGQVQKAKDWLPLARQAYGPEPDSYIAFLAATVHFEAGELDQAFALFDELFTASQSRPFHGEKPAYLAFSSSDESRSGQGCVSTC